MDWRIACFFAVGVVLASLVSAAESEPFEARATRIVADIVREFAIPADAHIVLRFTDVDETSAWARKYPSGNIVIALDPDKLANLSDAQLTGLLAHELSHVEVYESMSFIGLAVYGLRYSLSDDFKRSVEREADTLAITHGFGKELLSYREARLAAGSEEDVDFIRAYYLSPDEIRGLI